MSKRVIVTGASSGIGAATALALGKDGWHVALVARRADRMEALATEISTHGSQAHSIPADLSNAGEARQAMLKAEQELGSIDALVLCHGTNVPQRRLDELSVDDWDWLIAANLSSAFYCLRAILRGMRMRGAGKIVMISSVAAKHPSTVAGAAYSASKAGMHALCAVLNQEEGAHGIRATVIAPGSVDTEIMDLRPEPPSLEARAAMLQPEDIAQAVLHVLAQPDRVWVEKIVVYAAVGDR